MRGMGVGEQPRVRGEWQQQFGGYDARGGIRGRVRDQVHPQIFGQHPRRDALERGGHGGSHQDHHHHGAYSRTLRNPPRSKRFSTHRTSVPSALTMKILSSFLASFLHDKSALQMRVNINNKAKYTRIFQCERQPAPNYCFFSRRGT